MADNLTIDALLRWGSDRLHGPANPAERSDESRRDAELLLAHALSMSRTQLATHPEITADSIRASRFRELVERRAQGEPVAYLVGHRDFWTMRLAVTPAVLVPRPETELLIERVLALAGKGGCDVVDLGTGSGAIALALASERPDWSITAIDISEDALGVARANAARLALNNVRFMTGCWFEPVPGHRFDIVVSNPPYVAEGDPALRDLRFEPRSALTAGADGLAALRDIIRTAPGHLHPGGWLAVEHGFDQAEAVAQLLVVHGFGHVRSHRDLAGHARVTEAQRIRSGGNEDSP